MSWHADAQPLNPTTHRVTFRHNDAPATFGTVVAGLVDDATLRTLLIEQLRDTPFPAYFWELPPLSATTRDDPFEFVLVDSPALANVRPDWQPFSEHFRRDPSDAIAFTNLSGSSELIAPRPLEQTSSYPHLAAFARTAPDRQQHELWRLVGARLRVNETSPLWISTSGLGVHWLHVRLDDRPKYYTHRPYRDR